MSQNRGKTASNQAKISDIGTEKNNKVQVSPIKASRKNAFHPDSLSINALSREHFFKMPPEEKRYRQKKYDDLNIVSKNCFPQNVEAFTTLHDFDQMDQLVYHDEEEHQQERYDLDNHYEPTVLTNEHTKKTIKNYVKQKVERKIAQTIVDSVLYGQTPSQTKNNKELQAISLSCKRLTLERKIAPTIRDSVLYGQTPSQIY